MTHTPITTTQARELADGIEKIKHTIPYVKFHDAIHALRSPADQLDSRAARMVKPSLPAGFQMPGYIGVLQERDKQWVAALKQAGVNWGEG